MVRLRGRIGVEEIESSTSREIVLSIAPEMKLFVMDHFRLPSVMTKPLCFQ
jgi:hypothetical protein